MLNYLVQKFSEPITITPSVQQQKNFRNEIEIAASSARQWLQSFSSFVKNGRSFELPEKLGSRHLAYDFVVFRSCSAVA